jgi:hypothetical protein
MADSHDAPPNLRRRALAFIVLIGVVSLLADMVYEGARSLNEPYLALLGASGVAVGMIADLGELIALQTSFALRPIPAILAPAKHELLIAGAVALKAPEPGRAPTALAHVVSLLE